MKKTFKKIFSSFIETTGKIKFIFILFFSFFTSIIAVIEPIFFTEIIKKIENFYKTGIFDKQDILGAIFFWALFIVFSIGINYFYRYYLIGLNNIKNYKHQIHTYSKKIINMSFPEYLSRKQGAIYKIFDRGTDSQFFFIFIFFLDIVKGLLGIFIIIGILFYFDWRMTLVTLIILPIMILFGWIFYKKLGPIQKKLNDQWYSVFGDIGNMLSSFQLVKIMTIENSFLKGLDEKVDDVFKKQIQVDKGWSISGIYTVTAIMIARILVIGFGIFFILEGSLSFSLLFMFFSYIGFLYTPLSQISERLRTMQEQLTYIEKFYSEFDAIEQEREEKKGKNIAHIDGNIIFENVDFSYTKDKKILHLLNFEIKNGQKVAFVGDTGAGKSTIIHLILRFWEVSAGKIMLDGIDIREINKKSLRNHIGVVSQDNSLFNLSIKENLLFAKPKATKEDLETALKKAQCNFVFDFKDGLDTIIGERGLKLSGGEKQRLSIARLFLKNPEILILDEATSALDNKTEKLVQKALDTLMKGRTSIIIAHRLSTIQDADIVFVLEKGKLVEVGKYEELIEKKGKLYTLANPDKLMLN
ncbi:ABC transporter ATP-binding protein [Candidatus Gracilibacteria bacterium]|nr:ABC transporter ATP-binding protein [Candidatus Gracilibacteria bacterium]NUJ99401.1 ABC transporter ATP-binding protein [Candidatus Gracilibacteria bacterium]